MQVPDHLAVRLGAIALALGLALACALAGGASALALATSLHIYSPFAGDGIATGVHVTKQGRGYCWEGSLADERSDAWRCFLGNLILDPCFSTETGSSSFVLCANSSWSGVVRLTLTKRVPRSFGNRGGDPSTKPPWAVQLRGGNRCTVITGATGVIAGLRINYTYSGGGVLVGSPHRRSSTWTIFYAPSYHASSYTQTAVTQAWW